MKRVLIFLLLVFIFATQEVYAMKIYKYHDSRKPICANLWTGYYSDSNTHYEIGFGDDTTSPDDAKIIELSVQEYIDWVKSNKGTEEEALGVFSKLTSLVGKTINGKRAITAKEVILDASKMSKDLFSDPSGNLDSVSYQIKIISHAVSILFAYNGIINYTDVGIPGIVDKESADKYITNNLLPLWIKNNQIQSAAQQFIIDNALE